MDVISKLVAEALRQARIVQKCLDAKTIPLLEPRDRAFASDISRRIARRDIISEAFLTDLQALLVMINARAGDETTFGLAWSRARPVMRLRGSGSKRLRGCLPGRLRQNGGPRICGCRFARCRAGLFDRQRSLRHVTLSSASHVCAALTEPWLPASGRITRKRARQVPFFCCFVWRAIDILGHISPRGTPGRIWIPYQLTTRNFASAPSLSRCGNGLCTCARLYFTPDTTSCSVFIAMPPCE